MLSGGTLASGPAAFAMGGNQPPSQDDMYDFAIFHALSSPSHLVWSMAFGDWHGASMEILDGMVQQGMQNLKDAGEADLSQQLQNEWKTVYSTALTDANTVGVLDLGDHPPLSQWLANFIDVLNQKTRGIAGKMQLIADLTTLNYAIPIVFHPAGNWTGPYGDKAWIEYRLHFIPFANVLTYWGALEGCKYAAEQAGWQILEKVCDTVSNKLEFYMGRYLAPRISDYVFTDANPDTVIDDSGPTRPTQRTMTSFPSSSEILESIKQDNGGHL